jgi:citrate lyase gamma subunit
MTTFNRIAVASGFDSWDLMIEAAKETQVELVIPPYIPLQFSNNLFQTIRQMNFYIMVKDYKLLLTRESKSDIIEPQNQKGE